ncbi:MAG: GMC family oxidoreductase [Gemmatimonadetes bacterium]|nr:GMC family oxidoreductase [Gemmatimonadota bacterium]
MTPRLEVLGRRPSGYDAIIVGSGFGGSMVAHRLVHAGYRVLMLERGPWVRRGPENWAPDASLDLTPYYNTDIAYRVLDGASRSWAGACACVGGQSVFYGGVSLRFREADFAPDPEIVGASGARWPVGYSEFEAHYGEAERILNVAGDPEGDPTAPHRGSAYSQALGGLSPVSARIAGAARRLGLKPFRLPLAINYESAGRRMACIGCRTCDSFACAIGAKNDLAAGVLPRLIRAGLRVQANVLVTRLIQEGGRIIAVRCFDLGTAEEVTYRADLFVLAAGALGTPHLLLASDLARYNPARSVIGRYLTRHANAVVYGVFPWRPDPEKTFHKQIGIHDYYFGHPAVRHPRGKLGAIQQIHTPPVGLVKAHLPKGLGAVLEPAVEHLSGLLVMAEDQPRYENHVAVDSAARDRFGLPQLVIRHRYSERDEAARRALIRVAKRVLREAGALGFYVHQIETFSHALGSVRMGLDPHTAPLDSDGRFRGLPNLYVSDGSALPTAAGVNPSLTIAANALRIADAITRTARISRRSDQWKAMFV